MNAPGAEAAHDDPFASVLAAARVGAPWACTLLWVEHAPAVSAFVKSRGSREPEDLTSDVFLSVFAQLDRFSGDAAGFRSFVFSIAYRRLVDELRQRSRRGEHGELTAENDRRYAASAEDEALSSLGDEGALALLDGLPSDQRDVMSLRIITDLTVEQVAEVLGKRPGAVKALQRRALAALRKKVPHPRTLFEPTSDSGE